MHGSYLTSVTFRVSLGSPIKEVKQMLQNINGVFERAEASSGNELTMTHNKIIGNFVARTYILALKDEVLRAN